MQIKKTRRLVFYGKIENAVQEKRRSAQDWSKACDDFILSSPSEPHVYTHKQYLQRLAQARFGLCLAGYGNKCHREIECMAMGVVPIVAPDVDMSSYAVPPQEGVHYFRAKTPTEAKVLSKTTSDEEWQKMSLACHAWWKENASAEGMWRLTQRLASEP